MSERANSVARILALLLIGVGAWRIAVVVDAQPMLGYANQYDMGRTSACVGLWPALPEPARYDAHPQAPIARYMRGEVRSPECYFSSELAFAWIARALSGAPGIGSTSDALARAGNASPSHEGLDLRVVGAIKGATLVVVALLLNALLQRPVAGSRQAFAHVAWALVHATVFAIVICDPMNTLWLNTFYTEFAALLGAYAAATLLIVVAARTPANASPRRSAVAAFALSLIFLGFSRQQHLLLPAVLALPAIVSLWPYARRTAVALIILVGTIAFVQSGLNGRNPNITAANNADVVLGALLPASRDARQTAARLELPERCLQSSGASWYETMGESLQTTCPEALALPRTRLARLLFREPETIARAWLRGVPQLQDWRLGYLGQVEGREFAGADAVRAIAGPAATSVAPIVTAMSPAIFIFGLCASLIVLGSTAIAIMRSRHADTTSALALALYATTAIAWYAIGTAILGDGYVELPRHAQLAAPALFACALIVFFAAGESLAAASSPAAELTAWPRTAAWIATAVVLAAVAFGVVRTTMTTLPMANGVVDRPKQNVVRSNEHGPASDAAFEFAGWALDPAGVAGVELVTSSGARYPATYGLDYVGARGESLALYFPTYPDAARGGFVARLPARELAGGTVDVRTVVTNAAGVRTEIDRRRLVVAP